MFRANSTATKPGQKLSRQATPAAALASQCTSTPPAYPADTNKVAPCRISGRCIEPGCVFPVWDGRSGLCHYHVVLITEAEKFESCQPILEILRFYAVNGPDPVIEECRKQQNRMQEIVRELFRMGVA